MTFYLLIAIAALLIGLWNLMIAVLGLFPRFHSTAVGSLAKSHTHKNVPTKGGGRIPNLTKYTYLYTVNGREYKYTAEARHKKRRLPRKITIVYVKWFPRHGYPNEFSGAFQWIWGIGMLLWGFLLLYVIFTA